ncbi:MAG: hypothetical protein ACRCZB_08065 [Bacteroidales bacterium]
MCSVCRGLPDCPVCSDEEQTIECYDCNGSGVASYWDKDGNEVSKQVYDLLPDKGKEYDECEPCNGSGRLKVEYDKEYEHDER